MNSQGICSILKQAGFTALASSIAKRHALIFGLDLQLLSKEGRLVYWTQDKMVRVVFVTSGVDIDSIDVEWSYAQNNRETTTVHVDYYERNPRIAKVEKDEESVKRFIERVREVGFQTAYKKHNWIDKYVNIKHPNRLEVIR